MSTKEQLKNLRKKYHLGEFKNVRSVTMAKKRRFTRARRAVRHFKRSSVKSSNLKTIALMGVGAGVGSIASQYVRSAIPQANNLPSVLGIDLVELGLGYLAYKYGNKLPMGKFVSPIGAGMIVGAVGSGVYQLAGQYMGGTSSASVTLY